MIYIKLEDDMRLMITVNEPIYRGDNLSKSITYLVPLMVGEVDILTAVVYLTYIRADGSADIVRLKRQEELYEESHYQFVMPVTSELSKYAGQVCTWMQIYSGSSGTPVVAKSGECMMQVIESKNMNEYISDDIMNLMYKYDALINEKADSVTYDGETGALQLSSEGLPIGDSVTIPAMPAVEPEPEPEPTPEPDDGSGETPDTTP